MVVAVGPWIATLWELLGLPQRLDVRRPDGTVDRDVPMWTYWYLQEGEVALPPAPSAPTMAGSRRCSTSTPTGPSTTTTGRWSPIGPGVST